jgi:methionine-S-sulfoxide reductase
LIQSPNTTNKFFCSGLILFLSIIGSFFILSGIHASQIEGGDKMTSNVAIFAGGCFWCMQPPFDQAEGVLDTEVGYIGGHVKNPTYEQISTGRTGHAEAIRITYDPSIITYSELLDIFWRNIDPTTKNKQFADVGSQYRTAIFYLSKEERLTAEESREKIENSGFFGDPIVTEIVAADTFYIAEDYHDDYYKKNPLRYKMYKVGSGRDGYLKKMWNSK